MPAMEVATPAATEASAVSSSVPGEIPGNVKELLGATAQLDVPLEIKILSALVALLLFLLFLIAVLWDRYGKEIGELYTSRTQGQNTSADVKVHDVADEYSMYQKLPTFFYEYMPRRKKRD